MAATSLDVPPSEGLNTVVVGPAHSVQHLSGYQQACYVPEVGCSPQRTEDITNVVRRRNALLECFIPVVDDGLNNLDPRKVDVVDGRCVAVLVVVEQVLRGRLARVLPIEVAARAHEDDAAEVDQALNRAAKE